MKEVIKKLLREGLNTEDIFAKIKNDVRSSSVIHDFYVKASKYQKDEKDIVIKFLTMFSGEPENNYKRNGRTVLYHGSPDIIDTFKLTKGIRNIGGGNREVDNLGVFLTDNKKLADFFGDNRSEGQNKSKSTLNTYAVFVDLGRVLDSQNLPPNLKKIANIELHNYYGKRQNISPTNFWLLLDNPEFINEVKKSYDTVVFDEQKKVMKLANVNSGRTYFILDPNRIDKYEPLTFNELKNKIDYFVDIFKKLK
jgi:hypothetical protein